MCHGSNRKLTQGGRAPPLDHQLDDSGGTLLKVENIREIFFLICYSGGLFGGK